MRIVSKFHDYYDCIQAHGIDKSLVYVRQPKDYYYSLSWNREAIGIVEKTAEAYRYALPNTKRFEQKQIEWELEFEIVGFCGEWYIYATVTKKDKKSFEVLEKKYLCSPEEVEAWVENTNWESIKKFFYDGEYNSTYFLSKHSIGCKKDIKDVFLSVNKIPTDIFTEFRTPIVSFHWAEDPQRRNGYQHASVLRTNGSLKELGFQAIKDPYTCYQELSMYIGGVLGVGEPEIVSISDNDMRDKKGFNDLSFKTRPGTKKPRRKKKY